MSVGRWLRNKGFAFTSDQKFARWEDIGGPRRFEKWALQGPLEFMAGKSLAGLAGVAAALLTGWLLASQVGPGNPNAAFAVAKGMLLGTVLVVLVGGYPMWKRERGLYDAWLNKQERRRQVANHVPAGRESPPTP